MAISGETVIVGATGDSGNEEYAGAAYVFRRSSTDWQIDEKLTDIDGKAWDGFGCAVAIDGNTAVIGTNNAGAAYIFECYSSATSIAWTQTGKLTVPAQSHGQSVAVRATRSSASFVGTTAPKRA